MFYKKLLWATWFWCASFPETFFVTAIFFVVLSRARPMAWVIPASISAALVLLFAWRSAWYVAIDTYPELKLLLMFPLCYLNLRPEFKNLIVKRDIVDGFILFSLLIIAISVMGAEKILRFPDASASFGVMNSVYYGICGLILSIVCAGRRRYAVWALVLINGSGTALIALAAYCGFSLMASSAAWQKKMVTWILVVPLVTSAFLLGQADRGRDISRFLETDRIQLQLLSADIAISMETHEILFGNREPTLNIQHLSTISPSLALYLLAENGGVLYPRQMHSEYWRVYFNFGVMGMAILFAMMASLASSPGTMVALFVASFFGSTLYITPVFLVLLLISNSSDGGGYANRA